MSTEFTIADLKRGHTNLVRDYRYREFWITLVLVLGASLSGLGIVLIAAFAEQTVSAAVEAVLRS